MENKKKYIIIGLLVLAAIVLYFLLFKKNGEDESKEDLSNRQAARMATKDMSTVGTSSAVAKSAEDEEYQNLLDELKRVNNNELPAGATSYTAAQLRQKIKEIKALRDAYNQYAAEEDNEANQLTYEQLQDQNRGTVDDIIQLTNEVKQRKLDERLTNICNRFIASASRYTGGSAWTQANAWDEDVLQEMLQLSTEEKKRINKLYYQLTNGGLKLWAKDCQRGGQLLCASIYAVCNVPMNCAIGTTTGLSRKGWETVRKVREAFASIS